MAALVQHPYPLLSLPAEILLNTLARVDYAPGHFNPLRLVCRDFDSLLRQYEHSLSSEVLRLQFPEDIFARFPGMHLRGANINFNTIDEVCVRSYTLHRIERNCHNIRKREGKQAAWMRPEWINIQSAGMYLLYRIHDSGSYEDQSCVIRSLPATSLAVLLFTLILSIHQLRSDGPDILLHTRPTSFDVLRFEIELACEELLLQHGPAYLDALLCHNKPAIQLLECEVKGMEARQFPLENGKPQPKTLIAELRCTLADALSTDVRESSQDMWNILGRIGSLDAEGLIKVINGQELTGRKRQDSGVGL